MKSAPVEAKRRSRYRGPACPVAPRGKPGLKPADGTGVICGPRNPHPNSLCTSIAAPMILYVLPFIIINPCNLRNLRIVYCSLHFNIVEITLSISSSVIAVPDACPVQYTAYFTGGKHKPLSNKSSATFPPTTLTLTFHRVSSKNLTKLPRHTIAFQRFLRDFLSE